MTFKVVVTGFGPFGNHPINASWQAAKILQEFDWSSDEIQLIIEQIPVVYETVSSVVPLLWKKYEPQLMVHIGVSALATELVLETQAHRDGYKRRDVDGSLPQFGQICSGEQECLSPVLDVDKVCKDINNMVGSPVSVCLSRNAGRYLCEFIFYTSLSIDRSRVIFIHVPDIDKPYSSKKVAEGVREIILNLIEQIKANSSLKVF